MKTKIQLIQEDIDNGEMGNPENCPMVRAVNRVLDNTKYRGIMWHPYLEIVDRERGNRQTLVRIEEPIQKWMRDFDRDRHSVNPFEFELDIPDFYLKPGLLTAKQ